MKRIILTSLVSASLMFAGQGAYQSELTITAGGVKPEGNLDLENQLSLGLRVGNYVQSDYFDLVEFGYERAGGVDYVNSTQSTTINRFFVNLVKEYEINKKTALYTLAGVGYEDYTNEQFGNDSEAFFNYGVGVKHWVNDDFALKAEVRHAINSDSDNNFLYTVGFVIPFNKKVAEPVKAKPVIVEEAPQPIAAKIEPKPVIVKVEPPRDDDKDGVINQKDLCLQTPMGRVVNDNGCMKVVELKVNFATNQAVIASDYDGKIQEVADFMNDNKSYKVSLYGHTDWVGSLKYNQTLSEKRASAVADALNQLNVGNSRMTVIGYGESKPIVSNETEEGRAQNRRVEAHFSK